MLKVVAITKMSHKLNRKLKDKHKLNKILINSLKNNTCKIISSNISKI